MARSCAFIRSCFLIPLAVCALVLLTGCQSADVSAKGAGGGAVDEGAGSNGNVLPPGEGDLKEEWYLSGRIKSRSYWTVDTEGNFVPDGTYTIWYESGAKEGEYAYRLGRQHGKTVRWFSDGRKAFECEFEQGEIVPGSGWIWTEEGKKISLKMLYPDAEKRKAILSGPH